MDVQDSTPQLLTEILAELKHANNSERSGAVSSCKITLQRGSIDIAVHAYVGSDIEDARQEAVRAYRETLMDLNQDGVAAFQKTLEALQR